MSWAIIPLSANLQQIQNFQQRITAFFHKFLCKLGSVKDEFMKYPKSFDELKAVMNKYTTKNYLDVADQSMLFI